MPQDSNANRTFAICIETGNYAASLQRWKVYRVMEDSKAEPSGQIRVIDESGEDYLYPREYFEAVDLPRKVEDLYVKAPS